MDSRLCGNDDMGHGGNMGQGDPWTEQPLSKVAL